MRQCQRRDLQIPNLKATFDHVFFRHKIPARMVAIMKRMCVHAAQMAHGQLRGIDWKRPFLDVTKPPAIVHTHNVVGMSVRYQNSIQFTDVFP